MFLSCEKSTLGLVLVAALDVVTGTGLGLFLLKGVYCLFMDR